MTPAGPPRIAVLLDENTSGDASLYECPKSVFAMVADTGAMPVGIAFVPGREAEVLASCDGLLSPGGRFAFPAKWYQGGRGTVAPWSERCDFDIALMRAFLEADKPVLGICSGMQLMAGLSGCTLVGDLAADTDLSHNGKACFHDIAIDPATRLGSIMQVSHANVNSLHNEAVIDDVPGQIKVCARAPDGVIEAIERTDKRFAMGVQWHPERYHAVQHPGNQLFTEFVKAC